MPSLNNLFVISTAVIPKSSESSLTETFSFVTTADTTLQNGPENALRVVRGTAWLRKKCVPAACHLLPVVHRRI